MSVRTAASCVTTRGTSPRSGWEWRGSYWPAWRSAATCRYWPDWCRYDRRAARTALRRPQPAACRLSDYVYARLSVINDTVWHSTPDIGGSVARLHLSSCDHVLSNFSSQARYLHTSPVTVQTVVFYSLNSDEFQSTLHFDSMTYILFTVFNCVSTRLLNKHASCCLLACQTHTLANSDGASQISVFFCRWPFCTTVYISLTVAYDLDTK